MNRCWLTGFSLIYASLGMAGRPVCAAAPIAPPLCDLTFIEHSLEPDQRVIQD